MALRTSPTPIHNSYLFTTTPISSPDTPISSPPLPSCHHRSYLTIKHYHLITTTPIYHHHSCLITATLVSSPTLPSHHQRSCLITNSPISKTTTNKNKTTTKTPILLTELSPDPPPPPPLSFQDFLFLVAGSWCLCLKNASFTCAASHDQGGMYGWSASSE